MDDISDIRAYYAGNAEERRAQRHQLEFACTRRLLDHYLPKPVDVLELGAGAGYYTTRLARRGHRVTAVELEPSLAEKCRKALESEGEAGRQSRVVCGDAREAVAGHDSEFDAVLCMGPYYHLEREEDRVALLTAAVRALRPGGLLLSTALTRAGYLAYVLANQPAVLAHDVPGTLAVISNGVNPGHPRDGSFRGYFSSVRGAAIEHDRAGLSGIAVHALDPFLGGGDEPFNSLSPELQKQWADLAFSVSLEPDVVASSRTILVVGRKPN